MTERIATEREITGILRRLSAIEQRLGRLVGESTAYSFGTYSPTYLGGTTAGVTTYSFQNAAWTQIGKVLMARGQVVWTASTGTGNAQIGLPTAVSGGNHTGALYLNSVTFAAGAPELLAISGNSFFTMGSPASNAVPTVVQMEAAGNIIFTLVYIVA